MAEPILPASLADADVYTRRAQAAADKAAAKLEKRPPRSEDDTSFVDYAKTAAESAAAGVLSIPGAIAGAVGSGLAGIGVISPEAGQAVRENASGRALLANLVGAAHTLRGEEDQDSIAARQQYAAAARFRAEENPLTSLISEGAGQIGGLVATGGLAGAPGAAGGAVRSALGGGALARMAGTAVTTGIEGAAIGLGAEQNQAWVKEQHLTGQQVLAAIGFNGLVGGALGFGGSALVEGLGAAKSAIASRFASRAAEAATEATEAAAPGITEGAVKQRGVLRSLLAGDDAAVERVFSATTGEEAEAKMPEFYRAVVKGEKPAEDVTDKASKLLYEHSTKVEENLRTVTNEVSDQSLKLENVTKNFEKAPPPQGAVVKAKNAALDTWDQVRQAENKIVDSVSSALRAGGTEEGAALRAAHSKASAITKLRVELSNGVKEIASTQNPAEAYVAADQMRRNVLSTLDSVGRSAQSTADPLMGRVLRETAEDLRGIYQRSADHLFDEATWGQQGAVQRKVNEAWVDFINARKNVFRGFADQTGERLLPNGLKIPEFDMRESALSRLVGDMSGPGQRDATRRWTQYLDSTEKLTNAIGEGYALSGGKSAALDALNEGVQGVRKTVAEASTNLRAIGQAEDLVHAGHATGFEQHVGMAVGAAVGGTMAGPMGAAAGGYLGRAAGALTSPANLLEHRVQLQMVAERVQRNLKSALATYFDNIDQQAAGQAVRSTARETAERAGQVAAAAGSAARRAALPSAIMALQGRNRTPEEGYRKRAEQVIALTENDGQGVQQAVEKALGPVAAHDPQMAMGFTTSALAAAQYLKDKLPTPLLNQNSLTPMSSRPQPSRIELHEFAQIAQALDHPTEVISQGLATGSIGQPAMQAIKAVYPDYYEWIRQQTAEKIAERDAEGKPLPLRHIAILDTLLDLNGAGSPLLTDEFALQRGAAISAGQQRNQGPAPRKTTAKNPMGDRMAPPTAAFQRTS